MTLPPPAPDREPPDCSHMIVVRPEREGGVIFACTRPQGHVGEHQNNGMAEEYPLVENASDLPFLVRWAR